MSAAPSWETLARAAERKERAAAERFAAPLSPIQRTVLRAALEGYATNQSALVSMYQRWGEDNAAVEERLKATRALLRALD